MSRLQDLCKERGFPLIKMQMPPGPDQRAFFLFVRVVCAFTQIDRCELYLCFE